MHILKQSTVSKPVRPVASKPVYLVIENRCVMLVSSSNLSCNQNHITGAKKISLSGIYR